MRRQIVALALGAVLLTGGRAAAAGPLVVDGTALDAEESQVHSGTTYVPLRAVTQALRPDAQVSWEDGRAVVRLPELTLTAQPESSYLQANGRALYVRGGVLLDAGRTLVPVRPLAQALGAQVEWDGETGAVYVTGGAAAAPGEGYEEETLYWLSRIISAESRGEPLEGKIAVGNVILNRVASPDFPDSVYDVIFDPRWGGQFEPVRNGTIYQEPEEESILAAKLCLEGADAAGESLYFLAPALADNHWTMRERDYVTTIGSHWFYR